MTAALEGSEWSAAHPGRTLPPGKTRYPFYRRLSVPQGRSGQAKNLVPTGIRCRTVQPDFITLGNAISKLPEGGEEAPKHVRAFVIKFCIKYICVNFWYN